MEFYSETGAEMKQRLLIISALLLTPLLAQAGCGYLRTSYKVIACKPRAPGKETPYDAVSSTTTLPGLEEAAVGPLDELTCDCAYILQGSNPLCDSDREQEFSQSYPQDASAPVCPRAKSLCAGVCPQQIR
jgi:hypothetical protein